MMGKGHFTKFTLLKAVIIHIPARFLGHTASMLQYLVEAAVIIAAVIIAIIIIGHLYFTFLFRRNFLHSLVIIIIMYKIGLLAIAALAIC